MDPLSPVLLLRMKRIWLGTFDMSEEAAFEYEREALNIKGLDVITNFLCYVVTEDATTPDEVYCQPSPDLCSSKTSRFDELHSVILANMASDSGSSILGIITLPPPPIPLERQMMLLLNKRKED
ncbi:hypothetical protein K1719_011063 [Acacia pycnantha]|nr:hypothetical protein K1719_011063 [Acacia pycnantha]